LLNELMRERDVMTLHVESRNRARSLYERLGFTIVCEDGIYIEMRWQR
jgi:ribosomal protein S18 acetylase RimI-like enzyme